MLLEARDALGDDGRGDVELPRSGREAAKASYDKKGVDVEDGVDRAIR
jgi:hypothetical protein